MVLSNTVKVLLITALIYFRYVEAGKVNFKKCKNDGFSCNPTTDNKKTDLTFQCKTNITGQNVTIHFREFGAPDDIASLTIQNCETVRLNFGCNYAGPEIQWLKVTNVQNLEIIPASKIHMPPKVIIENITYLDTIPRHTFSQIIDSSGPCQRPKTDLNEIHLRNVTIGTIETEAFWNLTNIKNFSWINVSIHKTDTNAIQLSFSNKGFAHLHQCVLNIMEPMAFRITGDAFYVTHSKFGDIWGSGFNGSMSTFVFSNNSVSNIQSGAFSILAKNVYMVDNYFNIVESGAFQKIAPGLLRDSKMNFAKLRFVYTFTNNYLQTVLNGGVEPDMASYKNVASDVTYANNIMQVFVRTPSHENQQRTNIVWN